MVNATHFINYKDGAWVKGVPQLIPNLSPGNWVYLMQDKENGYEKRKYRIERVEIVASDKGDSILQNVMVYDLGVVESASYREEKPKSCYDRFLDEYHNFVIDKQKKYSDRTAVVIDGKVHRLVPVYSPASVDCATECSLYNLCGGMENEGRLLCNILGNPHEDQVFHCEEPV
jgi:hypothetical protein